MFPGEKDTVPDLSPGPSVYPRGGELELRRPGGDGGGGAGGLADEGGGQGREMDHLLNPEQPGMGNDPYCTIPTWEYGAPAVSPMRLRVISNASTGDVESNSQGRARKSFLSRYLGFIKPDGKFVKYWTKIFVVSCLAGFFIDPLFFFTLSVNQDNKCIVFNRTYAIRITVVRSVIDFVYLIHIPLEIRLKYVFRKSRINPPKANKRYFIGHFFLYLFVVLPFPQVIVLEVIPAYWGVKEANFAKNLLWTTLLLQNVVRTIKLYRFIARWSSRKFIFESAWSSFIVNLLMYALGGHVVGSVWYLFSFQRVHHCLRDACDDSKIANCKMFLDCGRGQKINSFTQYPDWESWKKNGNASSCLSEGSTFKYGIYKHAPEITKQRHFFDQYIYSLFWGFQQISSLAGNQDPSFYVWEVLFIIVIIMLGLLLFAMLIGNVQNFLQSLGRRRREVRLKRHDVKNWMVRQNFTKNLKSKVKKVEENRWDDNCAVHEEELLKSLPKDLQREIREHLFGFLEKVYIFSLMDRPMLDAFRGILRHKSYTAESYVQKKGAPIDKMVFVVRGKLKSIGADGISSLLHADDYCGEELLIWYLKHFSVNKGGEEIQGPTQRPPSNRDVKCTTNVIAFILQYSDLVDLNINFEEFLQKPAVPAAIRSMIRQGGLEVP